MSRPTDIAIDLETGGTRANAPIISIGACAINRNTYELGPSFYSTVKIEDALRYGKPSASTMHWWRTDMQKITPVWFDPKGVSLYEALRGLNDFVRAQPAGCKVWGNGSHFDISILEHGYDAVRVQGFCEEWKFWDVRDLRTAVDLSGFDVKSLPFTGTPHHALHDAIHQAKLIACSFAKWRGHAIPKFEGYQPLSLRTKPDPMPGTQANPEEDW